MKDIIDDLGGVCPYCEHRFRRVFEPSNLDDFQDEDGAPVSDYMEEGAIILLDVCLLTDIPMGKDTTYSCSHFSPKENKEKDDIDKPTLFKHL